MKRREFLVAAAAAALGGATGEAAGHVVRLANALWAVEIDPRTLKIVVEPAGSGARLVSRGVPGHRLQALVHDHMSASWQWDDHLDLSCSLSGPDLSIAVTAARAGGLTLLDQPPEALGKGLLLPIAEGYYVAADDARWRAALLQREGMSTAEELSLPLWGLDHGEHTLHWLLTNPFNNALHFTGDANGLAIGLTHAFTALSVGSPMTMVLHLGAADLLAGAKRYRRHLIERGSYRPLAEKIRLTPSAERLVGASHLYLWGNGLIGEKDVRDWPGFLAKLGSATGLPERICARFERMPAAGEKRATVRMFNTALTELARLEWQKEEVDTQRLVSVYREIREEVIEAFGTALSPDVSTWGSGLSKETFAAFEEAGLARLWIGLGDGWEGGLWRPEAVRAADGQGYLIAPYDSYETAIPPGERPDWATAQLGRRAYEECAVIDEAGNPIPGFQATGHYTNIRCTAPILKERVRALAEAGGFNSWFLDVLATGMVFDDYRAENRSTMAENAAANVAAMRWVSETLQLPVGSEGGNAVGAEGPLFAHGVETPLFGWGDQELRRDDKSPFFLGKWYPPEGPTLFFKGVPMKEPYRSLYFDPATRLPLYQCVFHGSVITSHQWLFDQLKLTNVAGDRSLIQQLYNVPPLFHINAETLAQRLPAIRRHDAFFRPMHERLATTTMDGFEWLSEDRLVQRTRFSDGTLLVANFAEAARMLDGIQLPERCVTAIVEGKPSLVFRA